MLTGQFSRASHLDEILKLDPKIQSRRTEGQKAASACRQGSFSPASTLAIRTSSNPRQFLRPRIVQTNELQTFYDNTPGTARGQDRPHCAGRELRPGLRSFTKLLSRISLRKPILKNLSTHKASRDPRSSQQKLQNHQEYRQEYRQETQ